MPIRADRSVGEAALSTGAVVGVFMVTVWGLGALGKAADGLMLSREEREIKRLERELQIRKLKGELGQE
jgi:hypothetical protein